MKGTRKATWRFSKDLLRELHRRLATNRGTKNPLSNLLASGQVIDAFFGIIQVVVTMLEVETEDCIVVADELELGFAKCCLEHHVRFHGMALAAVTMLPEVVFGK